MSQRFSEAELRAKLADMADTAQRQLNESPAYQLDPGLWNAVSILAEAIELISRQANV